MKSFAKILITVAVFSATVSFAQNSGFTRNYDETGYNPNSLPMNRVHISDIMYKKTVVRVMDLREKQNLPFFAENKELVKFMIDGVREGKLDAYATDSLDAGKRYTRDEFLERLKIPSEQAELTEEEKAFQQNDNNWGGEESVVEVGSPEYLPSQLYKVEVTEDVIFDKQRSRMYHDIQALTIKVTNPLTGIEEYLASFSYKDLVENVFRNNPNAVWFNPLNDAEHKNLAEAFELRLFSSRLIKVSNPKNMFLDEIYTKSEKQGLMASFWVEHDMMEFEHNLWEF